MIQSGRFLLQENPLFLILMPRLSKFSYSMEKPAVRFPKGMRFHRHSRP